MDRQTIPRGRKGPKAKTGCRTCKIRRVKCDEGRPACQRCMRTGRACSGYGVWDNHQSRPTHPTRDQNIPLTRPLIPLILPATGHHDRSGFEFFVTYTSTKMPGVFESKFWNSLVLQASWSEPAILQAVLALAAAHKRDISSHEGPDMQLPDCPGKYERAFLQHYSRAIELLQPHLTIKTKENLRIALISCIVFTCLEFLRRQYETGHALLQNCFKLLSDIESHYDDGRRQAVILKPEPTAVEDLLVEEVARVDTQAALLGYGSCQRYVVVPQLPSGTLLSSLKSVRVARQQLNTLLGMIHRLQTTIESPTDNEQSVRSVQAQWSSWLELYQHPSCRDGIPLPWNELKPDEVIQRILDLNMGGNEELGS